MVKSEVGSRSSGSRDLVAIPYVYSNISGDWETNMALLFMVSNGGIIGFVRGFHLKKLESSSACWKWQCDEVGERPAPSFYRLFLSILGNSGLIGQRIYNWKGYGRFSKLNILLQSQKLSN